jgi:hypothetical protein
LSLTATLCKDFRQFGQEILSICPDVNCFANDMAGCMALAFFWPIFLAKISLHFSRDSQQGSIKWIIAVWEPF